MPQSVSAAQPEDEDSLSAFDSDPPPPRAKRRKVSASKTATTAAKKVDKGKGKVRGKTGKLAFILDAPTEIVLGILSYLTPIDILSLSYVDKELRAMMTSPSSKSIWVAARQNVPGSLPECPVDFTESAYARFLFLNRCELCGGVAHGLASMCYVRIRLCSRCDRKHCVSSLGLYPLWPHERVENSDWKLIPRTLYYRDVDSPGKANAVFKPALDRLRKRLAQIPKGNEREEFTKERRELIDKVMDHATKLSTWLSEARDAKGRDEEDIRAERLENILTRLETLGYDRRDMTLENVERHRVVRQAVQLTDKLWPTVLRHLDPIVRGNRQLRLEREGHARIETALNSRFLTMWSSLQSDLDKHTYIPVADFLELPAVASVREASMDLNPLDIDTDQVLAAFDSNMTAISEQIDQFRATMRRDLYANWKRFNSEPPRLVDVANVDDVTIQQRLRLASTVFHLSRSQRPTCICSQPIHYVTLFESPLHCGNCWLAEFPFHMNVQPNLKHRWSYYRARLVSSQSSTAHMRTVITGARLDLDTATIDDLNHLGLYHPARANSDGPGASNAATALQKTTWTAEYKRLCGPAPTSAHAAHTVASLG